MTQESIDQERETLSSEENPDTRKEKSHSRLQDDWQYLQFKELKSIHVPSKYLLIDEALDEIGDKRFPSQWGFGPRFRELPFFGKTGVYKRFHLRKVKGIWKTEEIEFEIKEKQRKNFHLLKIRFILVKIPFIKAVEENKLVLRFFHPTLGVLNPLREGVLTAQRNLILSTGRGIPPRGRRGDKPLVVIVERESFFNWLEKVHFNEKDEEEANIRRQTGIPSSVSEATANFLRGKEMKFTKDWLLELLREAGGDKKPFADNAFQKQVWKDSAGVVTSAQKIKGPPSQVQKETMNNIREEALQIAVKAYEKVQP